MEGGVGGRGEGVGRAGQARVANDGRETGVTHDLPTEGARATASP